MRAQYTAWLDVQLIVCDGEDQIDPSNLLAWSKTLRTNATAAPGRMSIPATLSGTDGRAGRYAVIPIRSGNRVRWLDASGFRLAASEAPEGFPQVPPQSSDYDLIIDGRNASVVRQ